MNVIAPRACKCGAAISVDPGYSHAVCNACQGFWFPTKIEQSEDQIIPQDRTTPFSCPRCSIDLEVGKIGNTEICFCSSCRGFVVDSESLGGIIQMRRTMYDGPDDKPTPANFQELGVRSTCPACFAKMEAHHYCGPGNVVLDTCIGCQLAWLDHGELSKITRAPGLR